MLLRQPGVALISGSTIDYWRRYHNFKARDSRLIWQFSLVYRLPGTPIELALAAEGISRRGSILDLHERYQENRVYYRVGVIF